MDYRNDLAQALHEDGIEPTPEAIELLDVDLRRLAEILVDLHLFKKSHARLP